MRMLRAALLLLTSTALIAVLAACGGSAPVSLETIPVYTGAQPVAPDANFITDAMIKAIEQSNAGQDLTSQIGLYLLPEDAQWDDVKQFYMAEIGDDWTAEPELTQEADVINIIGWQRGGGSSEQILIVGQAEDPLSGNSFLLTGLFSEEGAGA